LIVCCFFFCYIYTLVITIEIVAEFGDGGQGGLYPLSAVSFHSWDHKTAPPDFAQLAATLKSTVDAVKKVSPKTLVYVTEFGYAHPYLQTANGMERFEHSIEKCHSESVGCYDPLTGMSFRHFILA
jgi:hypothetical protein